MAFPTSPTNGQTAVQNGITYTYATATKSWTRTPAVLPTLSAITDTFTGDGSTTSFTLSTTPLSSDYITINIDGVNQLKSAYSLTNNIVTFTGTPDINSVIEIKTITATNVGILTGLTFNNFVGDGTTTSFTLSTSPTNKNYTLVTVGGITQEKVNYGVSGTTLTFNTAPPSSAPIEVMTFGPAISSSMAGGSNTQIQFNNAGTLTGSNFLTFNNSTNTLTVSGTTNLGAVGNVKITGGTTGQLVSTDGTGNLSFINAPSSFNAGKAYTFNLFFGG